MLKDLPFFGTTRVANKGVDVALIVRPSHTAEEVKAADAAASAVSAPQCWR